MAQIFTSFFFLSSFLVLLASIQGSRAVVFDVTNNATTTAGGARFTREIGIGYTKPTLAAATDFTWRLFHENTPADRKTYEQESWFLDDIDGVAYTIGNETHVSAQYIESYAGDVKTEITGVIYHENTHIWQWDGNGNANGGLIEGIADYVRLKAGLAPSHWVKPGEGDQWDQGYDVTARFLDYLNSLKTGYVAQLNNKLKDGYSDSFFADLLGKTVDQLWKDYKDKYNH